MTSATLPPDASTTVRVFGDPQLHTDGDLLALTFAPDGSLWTLEEGGVLRHWSGAGKQLDWRSLSDMETLWCFSSDARVLASASDDVTVWDASSGLVLTAVPQPSWVTALAFGPDPMTQATGHDDGTVRVWDAAGQHLVRELRFHQRPISSLAFSPDGKKLAVAAEDKTISLWQTSDGKHLGNLLGHTDRIPALAWHPYEPFLVSAGWDTTARIWDSQRLQAVFLLNAHALQVTALAFSADGKLLASADSKWGVFVWDFASKKQLHHLEGPQAEIRCLAFSPDGQKLAASGDRVVHLWNPASGQPLTSVGRRNQAATTVAVSPDGRRVACNGGGANPRTWDTGTGQPLVSLGGDRIVHELVFNTDGKRIAGAAEATLRTWEAATGKVLADFDGPEEPLTCLAISPDGTTLAGASSEGLSVWLWRIADGEPILLIPDALDNCTIESLAFHPDGNLLAVGGIDWLATGGSDGAICLWNLAERCEVATLLGGSRALALHPNGKRLASASLEGSVLLWDLDTQELLGELLGHDGTVAAVAFSPDGRCLASGGEDHTLRLWSDSGDELAVVDLDSQIQSLAFSPDGRFLYTGNGNTTCSQLDISGLLREGK